MLCKVKSEPRVRVDTKGGLKISPRGDAIMAAGGKVEAGLGASEALIRSLSLALAAR